jgi:superfamily I DNA/RNA helicase
MRLHGFTEWLIESILQQEATMRFSQKFNGADVNSVPASFWTWLIDTMSKSPNWTPKVEDNDGRTMSRDQVLSLAQLRSSNKPYGQSEQKPAVAAPQNQKKPWFLAQILDDENNVDWLSVNYPELADSLGKHVVITREGADWVVLTRKGKTAKVKDADMRSIAKTVRDENNKILQDVDPEKLWLLAPEEEEKKEEPKAPLGSKNPHILDKEKLSEEQAQIDQKFAQMINSPAKTHMMISALAGTGKTTALKHLAWKYGKPGQKWLYLVFNSKNRAEAKENSGGFRKFPDWVEIHTTNSFLGHVMGHGKNLGVIPQTDRISSIQAEGEGNKKLEKARIIADGPTFAKLMTDTYHLPDWDKVKDQVPKLLRDFGVNEAFSRKESFFDICMKTVERTFDSIRYNFKERVLTLLGLLKSFAVDPRKKETLHKDVLRVFEKYDVANHEDGTKEDGYFDTSLEDVKERIAGYKPNFRNIILNVLHEILHYDFMSKNFKDEVIGAATWLLKESLPKESKETYTAKKAGATREMKHDLGDYRDFNDDIWFPTIYSDKIHFPHFDIVLADEVQDFNEGQLIMLKKLIEAGAKVVAVGDRNQSIYRFRGADNDAFQNISNMLKDQSHDKDNWKENSLSYNYRSRPEVLDFVNDQTHVKDLKAGKKFGEHEPPADVSRDKIKYADVFNELSKERLGGKKIETAFIARTNEPLVHAALKLLGKGIPFAIIGKDVSGDLVKHIFKLVRDWKLNDRTPLMRFRDVLSEHEEKEVTKHSKYSTKKEYLSNLKDITLALLASIDQATDGGKDTGKTIADFKSWLKTKLGKNTFDFDQSNESASEEDLKAFREKMEREKPIVLTTSHKSKGLEFSRVYILRDDQFPHPRAKHPDELGQEGNTKYVAYTRAMHQLHVLKLEGQPGYKED